MLSFWRPGLTCGWPAMAMLALGLISLLLGVAALLARGRRGVTIAVVAAVLAVGVLALGPVGQRRGRDAVEAAVAAVDPARAAEIRHVGYAEAASCIPASLQTGLLPLAVAAVALAVARRRRGG